jgi:hypothetical protein
MKILTVGTELFCEGGRMDRRADMTKLMVAFGQFCECVYVYLCVLCGSQNKQQLFPYTALTDWFL